jgi:preprotein translocase subunit SecG
MITLIAILHVIVAIILVVLVLLQDSKGAMGVFGGGGGGSKSLMGATGASTFLSKLSWIIATIFAITSITLAYLSTSGGSSSSVVDELATSTPPKAVETIDTDKKEEGQKQETKAESKGDTQAPVQNEAITPKKEESPKTEADKNTDVK